MRVTMDQSCELNLTRPKKLVYSDVRNFDLEEGHRKLTSKANSNERRNFTTMAQAHYKVLLGKFYWDSSPRQIPCSPCWIESLSK